MTSINSTKKIIICFGNLGIGGIQTKIVSISKYLLRTQGDTIRIHLVLRDTPAFNLEHLINLPNVIIHHRPKFRLGIIHVPFTLYYPWKIITIRPDVILSFFDYLSSLSIISSWLLFWKKIRIILNEDILSSAQSRSLFHKFLIHTFYPLADRIIVPTRTEKRDLVTHFGIPETKIVVIANWTQMTKGARVGHKIYDLVFIGRLEKQKNLLFLLRAMRLLLVWRPGLKLCLVGEGSEKQNLQTYMKHYHLSRNVTLHNSSHHVSVYIDQSKLFVLSSHFEGMPVALLEVMARDCPVVAMRYPGISELLIHGKTGLIADSMNEFVEDIRFLLTHPKQRLQMGEAAGIQVRTHFSRIPLRHYVRVLINN